MPDDLAEKLAENATGPASVDVDGVRVQQHPLPDVVETDRYLLKRGARRDPRVAFFRTRIVPPGSV